MLVTPVCRDTLLDSSHFCLVIHCCKISSVVNWSCVAMGWHTLVVSLLCQMRVDIQGLSHSVGGALPVCWW